MGLFDFWKKKAVPSVTIAVTIDGLSVNDQLVTSSDQLVAILGPATEKTVDVKTDTESYQRQVLVWEDLGIVQNLSDDPAKFSLEVALTTDSPIIKKRLVNQPFSGQVFLKHFKLLEYWSDEDLRNAYLFLEDKIADWEVAVDLTEYVRHELADLPLPDERRIAFIHVQKHPFSDFFLDYAPPKTKQPLDKYQPSSMANQIELTDFNFRLAIIQELMYEQDLLPRFDVWEFCDQYTAREIDIEEEGYDVIPEVKAWFEALPISREMAEQVTKLYFDGGNEIYGQIVPFWDGEDDLYDIAQLTLEDLAQFPNLKTIDGTVLLMTEEVKDTFRQAGIEIIE